MVKVQGLVIYFMVKGLLLAHKFVMCYLVMIFPARSVWVMLVWVRPKLCLQTTWLSSQLQNPAAKMLQQCRSCQTPDVDTLVRWFAGDDEMCQSY